MNVVDRIAHTNRWSCRHPGEKFLLGGGFLLFSITLPVIPGALLILVAAISTTVLAARVRSCDYLRLLLAPIGFLLISAVALAVSVNVDAGAPWVSVSMHSAAAAAEVSVRALAAMASLLLIVLTTPLTNLLAQLQRLRLPAPILDVTLMMYRFVTLTMGVAERTRLAQANRLGYSGVRRSIRSTGMLAATLLPRVLDRARRMETGLAARSYAGELRTLSSPVPLSPRFVAAALALHVVIVAASLSWRILADPLG